MWFHNSTLPGPEPLRTRSEVLQFTWWNLWARRLPPFHDLAGGSEIVLVDTWPGGGRLSWLVRAHDVHTDRYETPDEAVRVLARWAGRTRAQVLTDPYTAGRTGPGWLLAWRARPVQRLDLPRPADLEMGRHGWAFVDDPRTLARWGITGTAPRKKAPKKTAGNRGAGFGDAITNRAVELRAMDVAEKWCRAQGWRDIHNTSATESWDLEVRDRTPHLYVEVKGLRGSLIDVEVTRNEVDHANAHPDDSVLIVVTGIRITGAGLDTKGSGGTPHVFDRWRPADGDLRPSRYRWRPRR